MRTSYFILGTMAVALLTSCSTPKGQSTTQVATNFINRQHVVATTGQVYPAKNPQNIAVYTKEQKPLTPYRVIGIGTVSKYNLIGMERQDDTVHTMMKSLAASIGGDGIMNIDNNKDAMQASIIQFQKILL